MDEAYFLHVEDIDFCLRLRRAGGKIYFVPDVRIVHQKGSSAADPILVEWHKAKGFSRYFRTHFQKEYPRPFLWAVETLVFFRFGAVAIRQLARTLLGRGQRTGRSPPPTDTAAADRARTR
jgi:GT2 family glycosyltransferase